MMATGRTTTGLRGAREPIIGSREAAKDNARVRAREEGVPVFVLRYTDGGRAYTASRLPALSQHPTECHGHYTTRGTWVPCVVLDVDDAVAYLRSFKSAEYDEAARDIERVRGDKESGR